MEFSMRPSRVLRMLRAGEVVHCFKLNLSCSRAFEIVSRFGFDCAWTDMEHVANDWSAIERQILATKCYDVDLMCRVSRGAYSDYIHPLELDASGLMVPHIMSLEDARNVVRTTRFHPQGRRPVDGGNADGFYCNIEFNAYLEQANRERFVFLQIEDPEPLKELDAIADLEGYDGLFFGPGDFSHSIGAPGKWDHPEIAAARERVVKAARKYGKFAGIPATPANRRQFIDMGYTFLNVGADVIALSEYCRQLAAACGIDRPNPMARQGA